MSHFVQSLPKVELHVHLEAAITASLAQSLAHKHKIKLPPSIINENGNFTFKNYQDFQYQYDVIAKLIKTAKDYHQITYEYLKRLAKENTLYVELMLSPQHAKRNNTEYLEMVEGVLAGMEQAKQDFAIESNIIMVLVKQFGVEEAEETVRQIINYIHPKIKGITIAGDENCLAPSAFQHSFEMAASRGLKCSAHCGEVGGPENIWQAIQSLPIQRIGHGVKCIEDETLMAELRENNIALEICISSNIFTGVYANFHQHPFKKIFQYGIPVSINSDDPTFFATSLTHEYEIAAVEFGLTETDLLKITKQAIQHSFANEQTKAILLQRLQQSMADAII